MWAIQESFALQALYRFRIVLATLRATHSTFSSPVSPHKCNEKYRADALHFSLCELRTRSASLGILFRKLTKYLSYPTRARIY